MNKRMFQTAAALIVLGAAAAWGAADILPLEGVKAGMKGKGRSVFSGDKIEEFDVEILGVLANNSPKRSAIIARLSGLRLEQTGVLQGMSGSPVYIDGKLIGAVAFSFAYAKEPIAGITPIAEMLAIAGDPAPPAFPQPARIPFTRNISRRDLFEFHRDYFAGPPSLESEGRTGAALATPLYFAGFSPRLLDEVRPFFTRLGFLPLAAAAGQRSGISLQTDLTVREGDPLAIQLVSGDLDVSAIGTATHVDGARVFAFGHPLYNLGPVEYGMAKADILTVVPAYNNSFKIGAVGDTIGTIVQDRTAGAFGQIGQVPKLVPVRLTLTPEAGPAREYRFRVAADKILTPLLLNMAVSAVLGDAERSVGDLSLEVRGDVYTDTAPVQAVHIEDLFSGDFDDAVDGVSGLVTAVVYYLTNNEFRNVGIQQINLDVFAAERPKTAALERAWLDRYEVGPGESVGLKIYLKSYRGETKVEEIPFLTPGLPPGTEFNLVVADAASMQQIEIGQYRSRGFAPRSLEQLVRLLNNVRKNNRIYFKLVGPRPGLFLRGEEMPNLPPSMKALFASPRAGSATPVEISVSTLSDYQMPVPYAFEGMAVLPLKIRE